MYYEYRTYLLLVSPLLLFILVLTVSLYLVLLVLLTLKSFVAPTEQLRVFCGLADMKLVLFSSPPMITFPFSGSMKSGEIACL